MKKAQGLSLNMMVIAAIALVVLVVTIAVFSGFIGNKAVPFLSSQTECESQPQPGECMNRANCEGTPISGLGCKESEVCCIEYNER